MMTLLYGIEKTIWEKIFDVFVKTPSVDKVVLYGSRAKGTFKNGSDIDLAIFGDDFNLHLLRNLMDKLDDLLLPYTFDVVVYKDITNADLKLHIDRFGKIIYQKNSTNI